MNRDQSCAEIQAINCRLQTLITEISVAPWLGRGMDEWDRAYAPMLNEHLRLTGRTKKLRQALRGSYAEVDRRNTSRLLADYFDDVRDGRVGKQAFVRGIARLLDQY